MFGKPRGGTGRNRRGGASAHHRGHSSTLGDALPTQQQQQPNPNDVARHQARQHKGSSSPPPPPQPPGLPAPIPEMLPWLLISVASYCAFLMLPGRVTSPRTRVTLIGGNEFINVASHLHFCAWVWLLQDFVFRFCAIMLFPPKRAAVYFLSMFVLPSSQQEASLDQQQQQQQLPRAEVLSGEVSSIATEDISSTSTSTSSSFSILDIIISFFRALRSLFVQPAPGQLDFVPPDYKLFDSRTHGGIDKGATYWKYRSVCILSYVLMLLLWLVITYVYHTRHVFTMMKEKAEARKRGREERQKKSAKIKREFRQELEKKKDQIIEDQKAGKEVNPDDIEKVNSLLRQLETGEKNLAEDEFSDEDVDYDPYGRPVPDPPYIPTVSWMVLWSMTLAGAFVWVQGLPILVSSLFPVAVGGILMFCVLMPQ